MWRQSVPLGNAARATRRVCSGMGEGSCGCKDSGMLNAANQRGCSIFPQMQGIEFANSVLIAFILRQHAEDPVPNAVNGPTREAFMHGFVLAVAFRQVAPARPGAQGPEHSVDKAPIVLRRTAHTLFPPRQKILDTSPLCFGQLITRYHTSQ